MNRDHFSEMWEICFSMGIDEQISVKNDVQSLAALKPFFEKRLQQMIESNVSWNTKRDRIIVFSRFIDNIDRFLSTEHQT